jgi:putative heme-binding domain-containing protein
VVYGTKEVKNTKTPAQRADEKLLAEVKAPAGSNVSIFAAPPNISYPTCIAATLQDDLFVGVDLNGSLGQKQNKGKVVRCRDTDNDGKADQFVDFCEVESPRGLWWDGDKTLYVLHPPLLEKFIDDNGDGKADRHETLVKGLGWELKRRGADHTTNNFRMGIDGWFYIAVGDYGAPNAVGTDNKPVTLYGGGVMRVRPDGTGLEIIADGLRNIYDVAVSPTLDLFTRDNTNDGGGWNVRLSHIVPSGHYGYPTLFVNFPEDMIPAMVDYGGGSPCGSMFIDEPQMSGLFTCDWGRSIVYQHPLKAQGATYTPGEKEYVRIPRPTDIDVDGSGAVYISSWKDGGFDFSNPNVGFIAKVTQKGWARRNPPLNFTSLSDKDLVQTICERSAVKRSYAQQEILRRGSKFKAIELLSDAILTTANLGDLAALIFTYKLILGDKANEKLIEWSKTERIKEVCLRALADGNKGTVPTKVFREDVQNPNARVRAIAAFGIGRVGQVEDVDALVPLLDDADPIVKHVAENAMVRLGASQLALKVNALPVLKRLHRQDVVDGLLAKLKETTDPKSRLNLIITLARLHFKEVAWDGSTWWGTRPDTTGPYYYPTKWSESDRIATVLKTELEATKDSEQVQQLVSEYVRHRLDFPEINAKLLQVAKSQPGLRPAVIKTFVKKSTLPTEAIPIFVEVANDAGANADIRKSAIQSLIKSGSADARKGIISALTTAEKLPKPLEDVWNEFVQDGRNSQDFVIFQGLLQNGTVKEKELACCVLGSIAEKNLGDASIRSRAEATLNQAWTNTDQAAAFLKAIARMNLTSHASQLRKLAADTNSPLKKQAEATLKLLKIDNRFTNLPSIKAQPYDQVVAAIKEAKGEVGLGEKLFSRSGCINCHAVSATETVKGPLLAGITTRYNRIELTESILKPSAKIAQGFETNILNLASGKSVTGFVVKESGTELEIRDATGAVQVIKKDEIEERQHGKTSVMPEGVVDHLTVPELAAILAYLESLNGK